MTTLDALIHRLESISSNDNVAELRKCVSDSQDWLESSFNTHNTRLLVESRPLFVDALLKKCWQLFGLDNSTELSIIAVGGYGRGQLHPYSDIDILILYKNELSKDCEESIKQMISLLWDIKLDIGQAVRSVKETIKQAADDITIATNIIESRLLAGSQETYDSLKSAMQTEQFWSSSDFYLAKLEEQRQRHKKYNGTAYNLEPNLKENPGGLRDIQTTTWVAKKHFNVLKGHDLVKHGYLKHDELQELLECRDFFWQMRFVLQLQTGKNECRLLFDHQPEVAKAMGFGEGKKAVETMMKSFFRMTRRVIELNELLLHHFDNEILQSNNKQASTDIDDNFCLQKGLIKAKHNHVFSSPESLLSFFLTIANEKSVKGIHSSTLRQLRTARRKFEGSYLSEYPACRKLFIQLVRHENFFGTAWDLMHKHAIMQVYMYQWDHIVGLMQFDMFHAYTVDEHTHRLIKNIWQYTHPVGEQQFPRCERILSYSDKPELLYLAAIFHDICKGKGGDHSELGELEALLFARHHGLSDEDGELIAWLVKSHLMMSVVAQRRDIQDPDVIKEFAAKVGNEERLNFLYALTSADIRATNSSLWNKWKSNLLRDTYIYTKEFLKNEGTYDYQTKINENKKQALLRLIDDGLEESQVGQLWQTFDEQYFIRNRPHHVVWHTKEILAINGKDQLPLIVASNDVYRGGTAILIYTVDYPGMFSQVAGTLDNGGYSVHDAQVMVTTDSLAVNTIIVADKNGQRITVEETLQFLKDRIRVQLIERTPLLSKRRTSRQIKQFTIPTTVKFIPSQNNQTVLEISALDVPGLLARITSLFAKSDYHLHSAKISTIGEKAEDFFVISDKHYQPLSEQQCESLKEQLIKELDNHSTEKMKA